MADESHRDELARMRETVRESRREAHAAGMQLGEAAATLARHAEARVAADAATLVLAPPALERPAALMDVGELDLPSPAARPVTLSSGKSFAHRVEGARQTLHVDRYGVVSLR